jgi:hypothetical protein
VCTTPQALAEHHLQLEYLAQCRDLLGASLCSRQEEFQQAGRLEEERARHQPGCRDALLAAVSVGLESSTQCREELKRLQEFLRAQADAEFRYADRLEAQHRLFPPAVPAITTTAAASTTTTTTSTSGTSTSTSSSTSGSSSSTGSSEHDSDSPRKRATTTELLSKTREYLNIKDDAASTGTSTSSHGSSSSIATSEHESRKNAATANVKKASFQFFAGFSEFNSSSANKHRDLGNFILDSVLGVVTGLVMEVEEGERESESEILFTLCRD